MVVTTEVCGGEGGALTSSEQRPGRLDSPQGTGQPPNNKEFSVPTRQ